MEKHKFNINHHWVEIAVAALGTALFVFAALFLQADKEIALLAGIIPVSIGMSVALMKSFITSKTREAGKITILAPDQVAQISEQLINISGYRKSFADRALDQFSKNLEKISKGCVPLTEGEYFGAIQNDMNFCRDNGGVVYAVNCIDEIRLSDDKRQQEYINANFLAAKKGVQINRVYAVREENLNHPDYAEAFALIAKQMGTKNIQVHIVKLDAMADSDFKKDWVLFPSQTHKEPKPNAELKKYDRVYLAEPDQKDKGRVAEAQLLFDTNSEKYIREYREIFNLLKTASENDKAIREKILKFGEAR